VILYTIIERLVRHTKSELPKNYGFSNGIWFYKVKNSNC
jgi:hypothetical protein